MQYFEERDDVSARPRVLFVHMNFRSFQQTDLKLLREFCDVTAINFRWRPGELKSLLAALPRVDLLVGWFASHHTFLPALLGRALGKKVLIMAADYDLANEPWFGYGSMRRGGVRRPVVNAILKAADCVVVPSQFSEQLALRNTILSRQHNKIRILPCGFDTFVEYPTVPKEPVLLTVGDLNESNWIRKGQREFVRVAARLPHVSCYLVGRPSCQQFFDTVQTQASSNVLLTGYVDDAALRSLFSKSKAYAQLSYMEGFGCSVAEAMLARCVPVVTRSGSLPEVVGNCGYYVNYGDVNGACKAVKAALEDDTRGQLARERILSEFPMDRRRRGMRALIDVLYAGVS